MADEYEALVERIEALERRVQRTEAMSAIEMQNRALRYVQMNPKVWTRIKKDARESVRNKRRFSMAKEFEQLRESGWIQLNENEEYRCNNSFRAPLVRLLIEQYPQVEPYVERRRSKVDRFYGKGK